MIRRAAAGLILSLLAACQQPAVAASSKNAVHTPVAVRQAKEAPGLKVAILSGGCYWGNEAVFSHIKGVTSVVSGFQGGSKGNAEYEKVSAGNTGHAESVRITYDPAKVRYDQLLQVFFAVVADPTQLNRQGPDEGTQYRSAIVPVTEEQRLVASAYIAQLRASGLWRAPIVTKVEPNKGFFAASEDHQDFMLKNPRHSYITFWDVPKVAALKKLFPALYKPSFTPG